MCVRCAIGHLPAVVLGLAVLSAVMGLVVVAPGIGGTAEGVVEVADGVKTGAAEDTGTPAGVVGRAARHTYRFLHDAVRYRDRALDAFQA